MAEPDQDALDDGPMPRAPQQDREYEAVERLLKWVEELLDDAASTWQMAPGRLDNVFIGTFAKGTKTYRAVLLLCDRGYGQQAAMLNRSLFEHAIVAWWLLLCVEDEEWVMEALRQHRDHAGVLFQRAIEQHPELQEEGHEQTEFDAEYVEQLDQRFGNFGSQWHGKRLDQLVREVEEAVDERYESFFWKFFRFINHHNNYLLHHSSVGVADAVEWKHPDDTPKVRLGPSHEWLRESLWAGAWIYGLLIVATLRRLSPKLADEFGDLLDDVGRAFLVFNREQVKDVGRNDPCPCGSGQKFKRCHGPWVA